MPCASRWRPRRSGWTSCAPCTPRAAGRARRSRPSMTGWTATTPLRATRSRSTADTGRRSSARSRSAPSRLPRPRASPQSKRPSPLGDHSERCGHTKFQIPTVMVDAMNSAGPNLPAPVRKAAALARGIPDPLFLHRRSTSAEPSRPPVERSRWLAAINAIAALAITAAIAFRFAQSGMPASVMQEEAGVVAVGALYAALVIWIRSSPLVAHTGLGEGLVITEDGRFVTGNEAYLGLTGYTAAELAALPSLIDLAPADQREGLQAQLSARLGGGEAPVAYESALIRKDG